MEGTLDYKDLEEFFSAVNIKISSDGRKPPTNTDKVTHFIVSAMTKVVPTKHNYYDVFSGTRSTSNKSITVTNFNPLKDSIIVDYLSVYRPLCELTLNRFIHLAKARSMNKLIIRTKDDTLKEMLFKLKFSLVKSDGTYVRASIDL